MQDDTVLLRRHFREVGDERPRRLIGFRMDSILCHRDDIRPIFDLELEGSPLQAVRDEISLQRVRKYIVDNPCQWQQDKLFVE